MDFSKLRDAMIKEQLIARGVKDKRVLDAMRIIPRHIFVPKKMLSEAYADTPLPIGLNQTISQPYIVAFMTEALKLKSLNRVLEIGTGSGYQTAVLAKLVKKVYTVEILKAHSDAAKKRLKKLSITNVHFKVDDGYFGDKEHAPFDCIIIEAAAKKLPLRLLEQLKEGGKMILPLKDENGVESLTVVTKQGAGIKVQNILSVSFVPMIGKIQEEG